MSWYQLVLFLHVILVIIAFGMSYGYPIMFGMAGKEPQHANFALRVSASQYQAIMRPLFVVTPFLGLALVYISPFNWDLWKSEWLVISIALYIAAFFYGALVQMPTVKRLIELTSAQPTPDALAEIAALVKKTQTGGVFLGLTTIAITLMMIWKPGGQPLV